MPQDMVFKQSEGDVSKGDTEKTSSMLGCQPPSTNATKTLKSKTTTFVERKVPPVQLTPTFAPKSVLARKTTKEAYPNLIQNIPTYLIDMGLEDVHCELQYQKQTSSQLLAFVRTNSRMQFITLLTFIRRELTWSSRQRAQTYVMEVTSRQVSADTPTEPMVDAVAVVSPAKEKTSTRRTPEDSGSIFKVKCSNNGVLIYSCIIATRTELWDISDISTGLTDALLESQSTTRGGDSYPVKPLKTERCTDPVRRLTSPCPGGEEEKSGGRSNREIDDTPTGSKSNVLAIPPFQIRKFEEMAVVVTQVVDPGHFFIQHQDTNLTRLQTEMGLSESDASLSPMDNVPDIGNYAVGWFPEHQQWFRVRVTKICGVNKEALYNSTGSIENIEVEVQRVDFGDTAQISLKDLRELNRDIAAYPAQALQVALANVTPAVGIHWTDQAVSWFKDKVSNRTIYARLFTQERRVTVEMFMERGKIGAMRRGASLSLRLAQNGHANHSQLKNTGLRRSLALEQARKELSAWEKHLISCYKDKKYF